MRMPIPGPRAGLPILFTVSLLAWAAHAPGAQARTVAAEVRVLSGDGKTLADVRQQTGTTKVPTSPAARCFFGGVGGSGAPFATEGPNALGAVADAARGVKRLRPLAITDEFSFGLGVCGFGGFEADAGHYWSVRVNHEALQVGGDQYRLGPGDRVLWALVANPSCEPVPPYACDPGPPELEIKAPARAVPGEAFGVTVFQWSDDGRRSPAAGVRVTGAPTPTDAGGRAEVTLASSRKLGATRDGAMAASPVAVCARLPISLCARSRGRMVLGSSAADVLRGSGGPDLIRPGAGADRVNARGGGDVVDVRGGGLDRVKCGGGGDLVRADRRDRPGSDCERVSRK